MKWSDDDKAKLIRRHAEGLPLKAIARELDRKYSSVKAKAGALKLSEHKSVGDGRKFRATFVLPPAAAARLEAKMKAGTPIGRVVRLVLSEALRT